MPTRPTGAIHFDYMKFLVARDSIVLTFFGQEYALGPISFPEVDISRILVVTDALAKALHRIYPEFLEPVIFDATRLPGFPEPLMIPLSDIPQGKRLIIIRDAGIGDMIMLIPALKKLREIVGHKVEIGLCTLKDRHALVEGLGYANRLYPLPIRLSELVENADYFIGFPDIKGIYNRVNMTDFYLDSMNIDPEAIPASDKIPEIPRGLLRQEGTIREIRRVSGDWAIRAFYSPGASDPIRRLPPSILRTLARNFPDILFLTPETIPEEVKDLENIILIDTSASLSSFATAINECDILVSSDSGAYHIAAAIGKPSLVFFGPIPSMLRSTYYTYTVSLDPFDYMGETCVPPCGIHARTQRATLKPIGANMVRDLQQGTEIITFSGHVFSYDPSMGCPEAQAKGTRFSPCLESFSEESILQGFKRVLDLLALQRQGNKVRESMLEKASGN